MRRLLAGIVVLALIGVAIAERGSSAASARRPRAPVSVVVVTPGLKRLLSREILALRSTQPSAPLIARPPQSGYFPIVPERGVPCFVAGVARCPQNPVSGR